MAIVDRDSSGRVSIMEMSIVEMMSLCNVLIAGAKSPEVNLKQVQNIKGIIDGLTGQLKIAGNELSEASTRLEQKLVEWKIIVKN